MTIINKNRNCLEMKTISVRGQKKNKIFSVIRTSDFARRFQVADSPGYERFHCVILIFYYDVTSDFMLGPSKLLMQYANEIVLLNHTENLHGYRTSYEAYVHSLPILESMCVS